MHQMTADPRSRQAGPALAPRRAPPGEIVLVGAHGGAGVTTLAGLLRPAWDMGAVRRPGPGQRPLRPAGRPVVLVARSTAAAAARAVTATGLLAAQGVQVTVLAVIGDGLPEPAGTAMPGAGRSPATAGRGDAAPAAQPVTSTAATTAASHSPDSRRWERASGPPARRRRPAFPAASGRFTRTGAVLR